MNTPNINNHSLQYYEWHYSRDSPSLPIFVTAKQITGDTKSHPPTPGILPIGKSTWWKFVKEGKAPKGIKLGSRTTVWRLSDVIKFAESHADRGAK